MCYAITNLVPRTHRYLFRRRLVGLCSLFHVACLETLSEETLSLPCLAHHYLDGDLIDWLYAFPGDSDDEESALDFVETVGIYKGRVRETRNKPRLRAPRHKTGQCLIWCQMLVTGRFTEGHMIIQPQHQRMWGCLQEAFTSCYDAMIVRNTKFPYPFIIIMKLLVGIVCVLIPLAIHVIPLNERSKDDQVQCMCGFSSSQNEEDGGDFRLVFVRRDTFSLESCHRVEFSMWHSKIRWLLIVPLPPQGRLLHWKLILGCMVSFSYVSLVTLAESLQDPFGLDHYDHPMEQFQVDMDLCGRGGGKLVLW